jgi:FKBP-type peptidyl-prolyl cis-trans isomerase FkpA/FKBP-type peptidyl-prolyl cis-trans isomerase FklB
MRLTSASILLLSVALAVVPACAKNPPAAKGPPALVTEDDKTLYALGQIISKNLEAFQLTPQELEVVKAGIEDGVTGKAGTVDIAKYGDKIQEMHKARSAKLADKEKGDGQAYLTKAAAEQGATKTASGLVITTLTPGTGAAPAATDEVKVHYEGKLINGTVFDSSIQRGEPATFPLNGVIPCWTEALQLMQVGGKSRIVCPADLAYGERGAPPQIKPGATLTFEVQLLEIVKPQAK